MNRVVRWFNIRWREFKSKRNLKKLSKGKEAHMRVPDDDYIEFLGQLYYKDQQKKENKPE